MARPGLKIFSLDKVKPALEQERRDCFDVHAPLSRLRLDLGDPLAPSAVGRYRVRLEGTALDRPATLSPVALAQLGGIVGVPPAHLDRLPASLGLKTVRCLLEMQREDDRTLLFRFQGRGEPRLRACLPASFVRLDDRDVYAQLAEEAAGSGAKVTNLTLTDELFALRIAMPTDLDLGAVRGRDTAHPGVEVLSSEVGAHTLTVRVVLYRVVCANGITSVSEAQSFLRVRNTRLRPDAFRRAVHGAIREAGRFGETVARGLKESHASYAREPLREIQGIFQRYGLGSPTGRLARWVVDEIQHRHSLFGVSHFDIVNALTAVSQRLEHTRRLAWEDAAGAYLMGLMGTSRAA